MATEERIRCTDGCGRSIADADHTEGWTRLQITGRYRCVQCTRDLEAVNQEDKPVEARRS